MNKTKQISWMRYHRVVCDPAPTLRKGRGLDHTRLVSAAPRPSMIEVSEVSQAT